MPLREAAAPFDQDRPTNLPKSRRDDTSMPDPLRNGFELLWYEIESVIGKGGFGITYKARDKNLSRRVAIKEHFPGSFSERHGDQSVHPRDGMDGNYTWSLENFIAEARTLARFRHPNIVRVMSVFESLGTAYMVMDFEEGTGLKRAVSDNRYGTEPDMLRLISSLLDGLERVHEAGFIHRDIKPANIQIRKDGSPVLLDFGSARHDIAARQGDLTGLVSPHYAPFEQFKPDESDPIGQGAWSDIYALGATLFEAITQRRPPETLARASALLHGRPDPLPVLSEVAPQGYSERTLSAITASLAFSAADRPRSIADWRKMFPLENVAAEPSTVTVAANPASTTSDETRAIDDRPRAGAEAVTQVTQVTQAVPTVSLEGRSVMVVDDEAFILNLAVRLLQSMGATDTTSASSAHEAIERLGDGDHPDLLLLDLNLPDMDGIQMLGELNRLGYDGELVVVSGEESRVLKTAEAIASGHELHILGAVEKPMTRDKLARVLANADTLRPRGRDSATSNFAREELEEAFSRNQLITWYQPKIRVNSRALTGLEALVRWAHPERGMLLPGTFLTAFDEAGFSEQLSDYVTELALEHMGGWQQEGLQARLSINVPLDRILVPDYPERLVERADAQGVRAGQITLELAESSVDAKLMRQLEVLTRLRLRGVGLAVDDFGSGRVALVTLKTLPFTELKIDRDLVVSATTEHDARALVESAVDLGQRLDLSVVAEGVETDEEWSIISEIGCHEVQGSYIAPPMPANDVLDWAGKWER